MTAATIAAACPDLDVWGCDFNPAHVERGRDLTRRAGIDNCTFEERSFADLVENPHIGPPQADVIVVHGVWSWVAPKVRRAIVGVIRERLAPGGIAYVSHLAPLGWESLAPYREFMRLTAASDPRPSVETIVEISRLLNELHDQGVKFALSGEERNRLLQMSSDMEAYFVHEHLNTFTHPQFSVEVAAELSEAKCVLVGDNTLGDDYSSGMQPIVDGLDDVLRCDQMMLRLLDDVWTNGGFHADVYRRGRASLTPSERDELVDQLVVVSVYPDRRERVDPGELELASGVNASDLSALIDVLDRGPVRLGAAVAAVIPDQLDAGRLAMRAAIRAGIAGPAREPSISPVADQTAARLNALLLDEVRAGRPHTALCVPMLGGPLQVGPQAMRMLAAGEDHSMVDDPALAAANAPSTHPREWLPSLLQRLAIELG
jgi:hypothetical protein